MDMFGEDVLFSPLGSSPSAEPATTTAAADPQTTGDSLEGNREPTNCMCILSIFLLIELSQITRD